MTKTIRQSGRLEVNAHAQEGFSSQNAAPAKPCDDERYPGSFFRVPGVPKPGQTTWSIAK
ncbi:MAG: hypothetical protein PHH11_18595 [Methylomonas sp.]|nr:hypothetical protein [Methylomonas sp.]